MPMDRRTFLKTAGALGVGAGLTGCAEESEPENVDLETLIDDIDSGQVDQYMDSRFTTQGYSERHGEETFTYMVYNPATGIFEPRTESQPIYHLRPTPDTDQDYVRVRSEGADDVPWTLEDGELYDTPVNITGSLEEAETEDEETVYIIAADRIQDAITS